MSNTPVSESTATHPRRRGAHRAVPLVLAALLAMAGILGCLVITALADLAVTTAIESAPRGPSTGFTVTTHPDPYYVHSVDGIPVSAVTVTAPDGSTLPVHLTGYTYGYGPHKEGLEVGTFEAPAGAGLVDYRITATAAAESSPITLAVTTFDVAGTNRLRTVGVVVLLVVNLGAAGVLVVWGARPTATR